MNQQWFKIELLSNVAIHTRGTMVSARAGQEDFPGQWLMGAAAEKLYESLGEHAYQVFHSGKVQFGSALPLPQGAIAFPAPRCWHVDKHARLDKEHRYSKIRNAMYGGIEASDRSLKDAYFDQFGRLFRPRIDYHMKTAIDAVTGTPADHRLYGYESLSRDQCYVFRLSVEPGLPSNLFEKLVNVFRGEFRVGRSRGAEFGRVRCLAIDTPSDAPARQPINLGRKLVLWLLSDMALLDDASGQPSVLPTTRALGLGPGTLNLRQSSMAHDEEAVFNAHYGTFEMQHCRILRGSVLVFDMDQPLSEGQLFRLQNYGVGLFRQLGLGQLWVNPILLQEPIPNFPDADATSAEDVVPCPDQPLIAWLDRRLKSSKMADKAKEKGESLVEELRHLYSNTAYMDGSTTTAQFGPSRAQWGRVLELALRPGQQPEDLSKALFHGEKAICKTDDPVWESKLYSPTKVVSLRTWLMEQLNSIDSELHCAALAGLARSGMSLASQQSKKEASHGTL